MMNNIFFLLINIVNFVLVILFELLFINSSFAQTQISPKASMTINVTTVQQAQWAVNIKGSGSIGPWQEAIISTRVNGLPLIKLRVDTGSYVKQGQTLAQFDDRNARADVLKAEASLSLAISNASQAKINRDRALALKDFGAVSEESILDLTTLAETTKAQVDQAQAGLDSARVSLENTLVRAPDSGVITSRSATLGQVFGTSSELFRLNRKSRLEWRAEIPAQDMNQIKPGQLAQISLPDGTQIEGRVRQIAPSLSSNLRLGIVFVDIKSGNSARTSMYVEGNIQMGVTSALTVPAESVVIRDGRPYVFIVKGNRVKRISVITGRRQGQLIEVKQGLQPNQKVAVRGAGFLSDGDIIQVQAPSSSAINKRNKVVA